MITVEKAIARLRNGKLVIIVDGPNRENEGDLALALQGAKAENLKQMIGWAGSGLLALAFLASRHEELDIRLTPSRFRIDDTPFGESLDMHGVDEHASARGRLKTALAIMSAKTRAEDLARPGHVFTLRAQEEGVLKRPGHTEAIVDLCKLAGLYPAGFLSEITHGTGMARGWTLKVFAWWHRLGIVSISDIIEYRRKMEGRGNLR